MKAIWALCATGALAFSAAGCIIPEYFRLDYLRIGSANLDRTLVGSIDAVSFAAQTGLRGLGLQIEASAIGDDVRIVGRNASGDVLTVNLLRMQVDGQERTRVQIDSRPGDYDQALFHILAHFEQAKPGG